MNIYSTRRSAATKTIWAMMIALMIAIGTLATNSTALAAPAAPTDLTVTVPQNGTVALQWSDNSNNESQFYVYYQAGSSGLYNYLGRVNSNIEMFSTSSLGCGTYQFKVYAYSGGWSAPTNTVSADPCVITQPTTPECPLDHVCIYDDSNLSGDNYRFFDVTDVQYQEGWVQMSDYVDQNGSPWNDRVSSIYNNSPYEITLHAHETYSSDGYHDLAAGGMYETMPSGWDNVLDNFNVKLSGGGDIEQCEPADLVGMTGTQLVNSLSDKGYPCVDYVGQAMIALHQNGSYPLAQLLADMTNLLNGNEELALTSAVYIIDNYYVENSLIPAGTSETNTLVNLLVDISVDADFGETLHYRAPRFLSRLIQLEIATQMSCANVNDLITLLSSAEQWTVTQGAWNIQQIIQRHVTITGGGCSIQSMLNGLVTAFSNQTSVIAEGWVAFSLDSLYNWNSSLFNGISKPSGIGSLVATMQAQFEATNLPYTYSCPTYTTTSGQETISIEIRYGDNSPNLPNTAAVSGMCTRLKHEHNTFENLLGSVVYDPLDDNPSELTVVILPSNALYIDYMGVFINDAVYAGGVYHEQTGTLYTWDRTEADSVFTLDDLVQHEFGHFLTGRYIFPGPWFASPYFIAPDEGLAELIGQFDYSNGALSYNQLLSSVPDNGHLTGACALPDLIDIMYQPNTYSGYNYSDGYMFAYFMLIENNASGRNFYQSIQNGSYVQSPTNPSGSFPTYQSLWNNWQICP